MFQWVASSEGEWFNKDSTTLINCRHGSFSDLNCFKRNLPNDGTAGCVIQTDQCRKLLFRTLSCKEAVTIESAFDGAIEKLELVVRLQPDAFQRS